MSRTEECPQRLDLRSGFMKTIIKNQIERDEYDKHVKTQKKKAAKSQVSQNQQFNDIRTTPKRAAANLYVPPHRKNAESSGLRDAPVLAESAKVDAEALRFKIRERFAKQLGNSGIQGPSSNGAGKPNSSKQTATKSSSDLPPLFKLELEATDGTLHEIMVRKDDNPARLAKMVGQELELSNTCISNLREQLELQIKRHSTQ